MVERLGDEAAAHASALHASSLIIVSHTDFAPMVASRRTAGHAPVLAHDHLPLLRQGNVTAFCDHVAGDTPYLVDFPFRGTLAANRLKWAMQALSSMWLEVQASPDELVIATDVPTILEARATGKIALVLSFEGAGPIEDDPSLLTAFHRLGLRCVGLTHDFRNLLADGVRTGAAGGLTEFGRDVVREMNRIGLVIDVSHLNESGFWDVAKHSTAPLHASHSNCARICPSPRNLSDDMLRAIADSGGVVGFHALGALVQPAQGRPSIHALMAHLDHMLEVMGDDHVAIGPDIMEHYPDREYRMIWNPALPTARLDFQYPPEFDSLAKLPNLTLEMVRHGYSDQTVVKILGGNMLRLFSETWKA